MNRVRSGAMASILLCTLLQCAFPQSDNSTASGVVRDPSSAVVPNAKVVLKNQANGLTRESKTNESGNFVVPTIPSGMYTLTIELAGFKKYESKDNKIDASLPASFDVTLQVGSATEVVEVSATAAALQTESGAVGRLIEGKQLSDLQLNGRNPIFLALLKPGVRSGSMLSSFSYGMSQAGLSINGSRTQDVAIMYDGAPAVRTRSNGTSIGSADLDMTAEVQILTASYSAEYGRGAGGQVRVVSKSGTNQFHGTLYEYVRNQAFDANTWSRNRSASTNFAPSIHYNQYGYNLSGPVYIPKKWNEDKSKLFFVWSQEWVTHHRDSAGSKTVPTAAMRGGDFSELLSSNVFYNYKTVGVINDPTNGAPFAGNIIPKSRQSANGMGLLQVFPLPNYDVGTSTNFYSVALATTEQRKDSMSLDYLPTSKDSIKFRALLFHYVDTDPWGTNLLLTKKTTTRPNQTSSINWTRTLSPTLVNEFQVTASRDQVYLAMEDVPSFNRTTYGINYAYIYPNGKDRPNKLPAIDMTGFSTYTGSPYPSQSTGPIYTISNNITNIRGNHILKAGFMFERSGQNDYDQINVNGVPGGTDNQNGRFVFTHTRTGGSGLALGNAALGLFDTYAEIGQRSFTPYRHHMVEWFVQDSWKVNAKLKIEYGIRHSIIQPYYSLWNNMTIFDPKYYDTSKAVTIDASGNPVAGTGDLYNGIVIPGNGWPDAAKGRVNIAGNSAYDYLFRGGQEPRYYSNIDYLNFQPRLGMAYQISSKQVLRAGAGKFVTPLGVSDSVFLGGNPPLQPMASVSYGSVDSPGGGTAASFPLSVTTQAKEFHMPQSYTWNVNYEREVGFNTVLELAYVGRRSNFGQREKNINQAPLNSLYTNTSVNINAKRPYLGYGAIRETFNDANMTYNSAQINVNRRFANGLSFGLAYTYSKCMDDGSAQRDIVPNTYDAHNLWGPCTNDTRHLAVINYIYALPFFKNSRGLVKGIAGGWQISGVTQFQTGTPNTVATGDDIAGVGSGSGSQIWDVNGDPILPNDQKGIRLNSGDKIYWFRATTTGGAAMFTKPTQGTFTTQSNRDIIYNPGVQNWNLGIFKTFQINERHRVLLRGEAFSWLNHPNWNGADYTPTSSTFGMITSKADSQRQLQFSLRYSF
ncbi:TonB-dependent receptor [Paludibaculum fermentans]|uniref:Carboxypeptidase regulatory-like domain-containing protein n=1 Tax=Paludibaculum fermentans TaxID=1473598 RepID=A0A7S7SIE8_PALFE|nr:carboxypeptidase regulatory-like domain-containing protein [Paludibaculum fermentans]QOY86004.1 carboxypeptidase regulatory-like domain-containing protein [Paludibaculum fermentans]